ncbi:transcriptional regulator, partial [Streptomyces griseoincarnatus]
MGGPAAQEPEYAELIAELAALRDERLQKQPSDRALARAVGVSPTTIGNRLKGQFPQQIDQLLDMVRAVRAQAERAGLAGDQAAAAVLDVQKWRRAYQAEARRRADGTRAAVEAGQGRAVLERMRPGMLLAEVVDPFPLEVHRAIGSPVAGLPVLPAYVPREHDDRLAEVVAQAAAGASQMAVLAGGSSTGKTRACWEALQPLRERDEPWRLWHPIAPTRPDAALAELADVAPYTVIWLNEAQEYLLPSPLGEQIAARLRDLLRDPRRAPVLVLATLWLDHWDTLTTRTIPDRHALARELLDGHRIRVPDAFTGAALGALTDAAGTDPRLAEAAERATDGHVAQYLAGVPVLMERYKDTLPATKALIHAAMDARRLGAGPH